MGYKEMSVIYEQVPLEQTENIWMKLVNH
jgi:hypothetical protein